MEVYKRKVAAVIVTFNRLEKLKDTLEKTFAEPFSAVVVVNNCSTDGTGNWLDGLHEPRLHIIHSPSNQGGAGGFHQGFEYAAQKLPECDWLVAFDDDAYPLPGTLKQFDALDVPAEVGSVAAAVYLPDGRISEMNRPSVNPFWHLKKFLSTALRGRQGFHVADADYSLTEHKEIDASSFVGFFLRLSLIREGRIGLPRTELFIYADDIIYVLEMRKTGVKHWFVPWLEFSHDCQTLVNQKGVYRPLWKVYFVVRNRLEMYRIVSGVAFPIVLLIKIPKFFLEARFYAPNERMRYLKVSAKAMWNGICRNFSKTFQQVIALSE
ncbi:MAG: glycosyltransferase [Xanthomonadales bacterium]|nr:glycosyltransferase [Xanthomonadales bacterium]